MKIALIRTEVLQHLLSWPLCIIISSRAESVKHMKLECFYGFCVDVECAEEAQCEQIKMREVQLSGRGDKDLCLETVRPVNAKWAQEH